MLFILTNIYSQKIIPIDLARAARENNSSINPGAYIFKFTNVPPGSTYDEFTIEVVDQAIPVLDPIDVSPIVNSPSIRLASTCRPDSLIDILMAIKTEAGVVNFKNKLDTLVGHCSGDIITLLKLKTDSLTTRYYETINVKKGQNIEIYVKRNDPVVDAISKQWIYKTQKRGEWITSYGINAISRFTSTERHYFVKHTAGDSSRITKERKLETGNFAGAILFSWIPNNGVNAPVVYTGGLGANTEDLSLYSGLTVAINYNILINLGMAAHLKWELLGRYKNNQAVLEDLQFEQLHNKVPALNPFIGMSFRFADNPFKDE